MQIQEAGRTIFTKFWIAPILMISVGVVLSRVDGYSLGYVMYRLASDVEELPFPMAPVAALGTMALAESTEEKKEGWKWRVFSIGGVIGLAFGAVYVLLPVASGLIFTEAIRIMLMMT